MSGNGNPQMTDIAIRAQRGFPVVQLPMDNMNPVASGLISGAPQSDGIL